MPARSTAKKKKRYRQIKGVKYDDAALTLCEDAILHGGRVTLFDAKAIHADVQDGGRVTPIEWATLKFIAEGGNGGAQFRVDASASAWLKARCEEHDPETGVTPARAPRAYRVEDGERCDANALARFASTPSSATCSRSHSPPQSSSRTHSNIASATSTRSEALLAAQLADRAASRDRSRDTLASPIE